MKIIIVHPFSDSRPWIKGRRYEVDDKTGAGFIRAGLARIAYEDLVKELVEARVAGLVVSDGTDKALVAEAKAAGLQIGKPRGRPRKADPDPDHDPDE